MWLKRRLPVNWPAGPISSASGPIVLKNSEAGATLRLDTVVFGRPGQGGPSCGGSVRWPRGGIRRSRLVVRATADDRVSEFASGARTPSRLFSVAGATQHTLRSQRCCAPRRAPLRVRYARFCAAAGSGSIAVSKDTRRNRPCERDSATIHQAAALPAPRGLRCEITEGLCRRGARNDLVRPRR